MISNVSSSCGRLIVDVYLLNDSKTEVSNDLPLSDVTLTANGERLHPILHTKAPSEMIAPGSFAGPLRYTAEVSTALTGQGTLTLQSLPPVGFKFGTGNRCPSKTDAGN